MTEFEMTMLILAVFAVGVLLGFISGQIHSLVKEENI